jgi:hypothetical protein
MENSKRFTLLPQMLTLGAALLIAPWLLAQSAEPARSNFKVVYSFTGTKDGGLPETQLVLDKFGNAYGSTAAGGNCDLSTRCSQQVNSPFAPNRRSWWC